MPNMVHPTTILDCSDLEAQCELPRVKARFEDVLDAINDSLLALEHVLGVQITGSTITVLWDYQLPTSHVARRELEVERAVKAVLLHLLPELLPAKQ